MRNFVGILAVIAGIITVVSFLFGRDSVRDVVEQGVRPSGEKEMKSNVLEGRYGNKDRLYDEIRESEDRSRYPRASPWHSLSKFKLRLT